MLGLGLKANIIGLGLEDPDIHFVAAISNRKSRWLFIGDSSVTEKRLILIITLCEVC